MSYDWLITFRSVTFAQKAERLLKKAGIICLLQRTPNIFSERGCGYCLRLRSSDTTAAVGMLKENHVPYGKVYEWTEGHP